MVQIQTQRRDSSTFLSFNIPNTETKTSFKAHRPTWELCSSLLCLDIYIPAAVMSCQSPKFWNLCTSLTPFHAGVNWCRWPVKPALKSTGGDGRSLQWLIFSSIYSIRRISSSKSQSITWTREKHRHLLFSVVFPLPEDSTAFYNCKPLSPTVHLSCVLIC